MNGYFELRLHLTADIFISHQQSQIMEAVIIEQSYVSEIIISEHEHS